MDAAAIRELVRSRCRPLAPVPTDVAAAGHPLRGVRAVLFDVYGTLLVSGAGDIAASPGLMPAIRRAHEAARANGIDGPEVDVREIWREVDPGVREVERHAVEQELAANPVWPMPGFPAVLEALRGRVLLGIVSNAQFYTPLTLEALAGRSLEALGFEPSLCLWSYVLRRAKPSPALFADAARALAQRGVAPGAAVMLGNSAVKDVAPAQAAGLRAILFAGDARSYAPHADVRPDAVITALDQLPGALAL